MGIVEPHRPGGGYGPPPYQNRPFEKITYQTPYWVFIVPSIAAVGLVAALACVAHLYHYSRHGGRYTYSALDDELANGDRLEMEPKVSRKAARDTAALAARSYCRTQHRYSMSEHLHDIGSRIDKNWFLIRDVNVKTDRLMTLLPYEDGCPITLQTNTKEALIELFQAIQHPYIYPVLDFDFITITSTTYIINVIPYNQKGTLKDLIYRSQWKDDWSEKYQQRASGLPMKQVQRLGRQILEALLYLQDRGFPPCGHIHSGNIVLQNGVARLCGLENTLLGLTSRIYPIIRRRLRDNKDAIDSVCFGHMLFEMCAGYELSSAHPNAKHLEDIAGYTQAVPVLEYIFGCGEQYPSIEEILCCDFFRKLDLREMRAMPLPAHFQLPYSAPVRYILGEVRRQQKQKRSKRGLRQTVEDGSTPTSSEASTSGAAAGGNEEQLNYNNSNPFIVSPSKETPAHRDLKSPQRSVTSSIPSSPENFYYQTPPQSPPTILYNDRPLSTTRGRNNNNSDSTYLNNMQSVVTKTAKQTGQNKNISRKPLGLSSSSSTSDASRLSPYYTPKKATNIMQAAISSSHKTRKY